MTEPTTEPTPEPTPEPTMEATTEATTKPTTKPTPEPTTEPTTEPEKKFDGESYLNGLVDANTKDLDNVKALQQENALLKQKLAVIEPAYKELKESGISLVAPQAQPKQEISNEEIDKILQQYS